MIFKILKFFIYICFVLHFLACMLLYLGLNYENSWLVHLDPTDGGKRAWWKDYIASYYAIMTVVATIGYGDVFAHNRQEYIFLMVI